MIKNIFADPVDIRLLSPFAVVFGPEGPAYLVKEFGFLGGKSFYSVIAQENPHLNDSEQRGNRRKRLKLRMAK